MLLVPVLHQEGLRLLFEPPRLVELGLDPIAPLIDAFDRHIVDTEITEHAEKDEERDGDPEFSFQHRSLYCLIAAAAASATSPAEGADPMSRSTIAAAASLAIPPTLPIAA